MSGRSFDDKQTYYASVGMGLEVGKSFMRRDGVVVKITGFSDASFSPAWTTSDGGWYDADGKAASGPDHPTDLIKEVCNA